MIYPHASPILDRHRLDDERGLQYNWSRYPKMLDIMSMITMTHPELHVPDPAQAFQDAFADALHHAQAAQIDEQELKAPGTGTWDGRPVWLEFSTPQPFDNTMDFEGALMYMLPLAGKRVLFTVLLSRTVEWLQLVVLSSDMSLADMLANVPSTNRLHVLLCALTHLPPLQDPPPQHEPLPLLQARLALHLKRLRTLSPATHAVLPQHRAARRGDWDSRVYAPSSEVGLLLMLHDRLDFETALRAAAETALLAAWQHEQIVIRIDEAVIAQLRMAPLPSRLPSELPGLRAHAIYVPLPGGLTWRSQLGFFAGLDQVGGVVRLLVTIESRTYGRTDLVPFSLALGVNVQEELASLVKGHSANFSPADIARVHSCIALVLRCLMFLSDPDTTFHQSGEQSPLSRERDQVSVVEDSMVRVWEARKGAQNLVSTAPAGVRP